MKMKQIIMRTLVAIVIITLPCGTLTACSKKKKTSSSNPNSISIKYIGNSCFYITFTDGTKLVSDPYGSSFEQYFGKFPKLKADVMTISHLHSDHTDGISDIKGNPTVVHADDINKTIKVGDVEITGYSTDHVANMGKNNLFVYKENGLKIVNMGETDNISAKEIQDVIKDADVVLTYAGEYGKTKNKDNFKTLFELNAKALIPEHYSMDPDMPFYQQPTIKKIISELPKGTKITKTDNFIVEKGLKKQFVKMTRMKSK